MCGDRHPTASSLESVRITVQTYLRITESIESDMLSHDRHISIKLWSVDHSSLFDYRVRAGARERSTAVLTRDAPLVHHAQNTTGTPFIREGARAA